MNLEGGGLKDDSFFGQELIRRSFRTCIQNQTPWSDIIINKYICLNNFINHIETRNKSLVKASNQWKALTLVLA